MHKDGCSPIDNPSCAALVKVGAISRGDSRWCPHVVPFFSLLLCPRGSAQALAFFLLRELYASSRLQVDGRRTSDYEALHLNYEAQGAHYTSIHIDLEFSGPEALNLVVRRYIYACKQGTPVTEKVSILALRDDYYEQH